jgi:hypothetical protein
LEEVNQDQKSKLDKAAPFLQSDEGRQAIAHADELRGVKNLMYIGWGLAIFFGLGLLGAYIYFKPLADDAPKEEEPSAHRID